MDFLNIIGTLFDNSVEHVVALAHQIRDLRLGKNQQDINEDIYDKIENISDKSKGYFDSYDILVQEYPSPSVGDWAIVKNSSDKKLYIYKCNTSGIWEETDKEYEQEINLNGYTKTSDFKTINGESIIGNGNIEITTNTNIPASQANDGLLSKELYSYLVGLKNTTIPEMQEDINNILSLLDDQHGSEYIENIISRYNQIQEFINSIDESEDSHIILEQLINNINTLQSDITSERNRAIERELALSNRITLLEQQKPVSTDSVKHIFLTQSEYEELDNYEKDTLYLIIENSGSGSRFGDSFPLILG